MGGPAIHHSAEQGFEALEALWMLRTALTAVREEHELARLIATSLPLLLSCRLSGVALHEEESATWDIVLQRQGTVYSAADSAAFLAAWTPFLEEARGRGGTILLAGSQEDSSPQNRLLQDLQISGLTLIPLLTLQSQVGLLMVSRESAEDGALADLCLLQTLAECVAAMIEQLRQQKVLAQQQTLITREETAEQDSLQDRYRALLEIHQASLALLPWPLRLQTILQILQRIFPYDRAALTMYDPQRDTFRICAHGGLILQFSNSENEPEVPRQGSLWGWVYEHQVPLLRHDLRQERQFPLEDRLLEVGICSYVVVPLLAQHKVIGTLNVGSTIPYRYQAEDVRFLQEVALPLTLLLEHMRAVLQVEAIQESALVLPRTSIVPHHSTEPCMTAMIGESPAFRKMIRLVQAVAPADTTVLLLGETGTGKELLAKALHRLSPRRDRPLISVNCAAFPAGLIESELFGHERGAFTGAAARKIGRFELADSGTIFLDEIGDLPLELQAKLLRVLQEGEFERLGSSQTRKVHVRVIAATNHNLEQAIAQGTFRADLYYRLQVFPISLPPLRQRSQDIPLLVHHFVARYSAKMGKRVPDVPPGVMETLQRYSWPGNIRELENVIERAVILTTGASLELPDWAPSLTSSPVSPLSPVAPPAATEQHAIPTLQELERDHILHVLERTGWRVSGEHGAARVLGLKPTTLEARMKKLAIHRKTFSIPTYRKTPNLSGSESSSYSL